MRIVFVLMALFWSFGGSSIEHIDLNLEKNEIAFTFFDLSDGEAVLIQNNEQNVLINTGSSDSRDELFERLRVYDVDDLDKIIVTNASEDYTGNLKEVIDRFHVSAVISTKSILQRLALKMDLSNVSTEKWAEGKQKDVIPGLETTVLYVTSPDQEQAAMNVRFQYGSEKLLYMGMTDRVAEKSLMENASIQCDILKVGNFGIDNGILPEFIKKANPQIAVLFHKEGTVPDEELLELLESDWVDLYITHQTGNLTVKITPSSYRTIVIPMEQQET